MSEHGRLQCSCASFPLRPTQRDSRMLSSWEPRRRLRPVRCAAEKQVEMGLTLRGEGRAAAAPVQPSSVPTPSIYFGSGQQTPLGTEAPGATGAGRRLRDEAVQNKPNPNPGFRAGRAWCIAGLFHDCQGHCAELDTPRPLVPGRPPFPEKAPQQIPNGHGHEL